MLQNKIYISGLNMTGKTLLMSLLNGNSSICCYPFHKFGLSSDYKKFKNHFLPKIMSMYPSTKKYFEYNEKKLLK